MDDAAVIPVTPKKKRRLGSPDSLVKSPYFSPSLKCTGKSSKDIDCSSPLASLKNNLNKETQLINDSTSLDWQSSGITTNCLPSSLPTAPANNQPNFIIALGRVKPTLIQELVADDPWKVLIAVTLGLLNKTNGKLAIPTFWDVITSWPTLLELSQAVEEDLVSTIRHLGTYRIRSKRLIAISRSYIQDPPTIFDMRVSKTARISCPAGRKSQYFMRKSTRSRSTQYPATPISHIPGVGPYALDSYRIFCTIHKNSYSEEWKTVMPNDKELIRYLKWKWAYIENLEWSPVNGPGSIVTDEYLLELMHDLEINAP